MIDISSKKILFIAPKFYGYHQEIIDYMESNGADVTFFAEDIYTPLYRFSNKIIPKLAVFAFRRISEVTSESGILYILAAVAA